MTGVVSLALVAILILVAPLGVYFYLQKRWFVAQSVERILMYFLVFVSFPGLLLFSPFLNLRPQPRSIED
jgi:NAD(P)H-quinone oxidoreductase subunit L